MSKRIFLPPACKAIATCFSPYKKDILVFHEGNNMYGNGCNIVSRYYLCHVDSNKCIHLHNYVRRIFPPESLPDQLSFPPFPVHLPSLKNFYNICMIKTTILPLLYGFGIVRIKKLSITMFQCFYLFFTILAKASVAILDIFLCSSNAFHSSSVIPSIYFIRIFERSSYSCISSSYFLFK